MFGLISILAIALGDDHNCDWGKYWNSATQSCVACNVACGSCTGPAAYDCTQCASVYKLIQGICMLSCPLGYEQIGNTCVDRTTNGVAYNINFNKISNSVEDLAKVLGNVIPISSGSTSSYYPTYDANDPYAIKSRGFYFTGSSYFKGTDSSLNFSPVFTLIMWLRPKAGTCYVFTKQTSASIYVAFSLNNYVPSASLFVGSTQTFAGLTSLTESSWNFIMLKAGLSSSFKSFLSITVGTSTSTSSVYGTYFTDIYSNFYTTTGAQYANGAYTGFYKGFMWSFVLCNKDVSASGYLQTSNCVGCSLCPASNSNACLSSCEYTQYINNGACADCNSNCQSYGCVRNDIRCNLCNDQKCKQCSLFSQTCTLCVENAYLLTNTVCNCNYNYIWDTYLEKCRPCSDQCSTCDGGGYLGCSACKPGFYLHWGLCLGSCPTGYSISSGTCVLTGSKTIMNMKFNKIQGVVYDSVNAIPAVTGLSSVFYPTYETKDPIAALSRGYYFKGTSIMNFAPYSTYTTPFLIFSPVCYIAVWICPGQANGIIFSDVNPSYSIIAKVSLANLYPKIQLALSLSSSSSIQTYPSYTSPAAVSLNSWSYVLFSISLDSHEQTFITCYINTVASTSTLLGDGHFTDVTQDNLMLLGTAKTGSSTYDSSYYVGYIYQIIVDVDLGNPNTYIGTVCNSGCTYCLPDKTCLSTCALDSYPSGSNPGSCTSCNSNCNTVGCVDDRDNCNLCQDDSCLVCSTYDTNDCSTYKCTNGQYKVPGMSGCANCDPSCAACNNAGPMACTSCSGSYLLNGACHAFCPTGYSASGSVCNFVSSLVVNLDLSKIKGIVPDLQSGYQTTSGSTNSYYPTFDSFDPWPTKSRGYYFHVGSYLTFPPNSVDSNKLALGNQFTITMWLRSESDGYVISRLDNSYNTFLTLSLANGLQTLKLNLKSGVVSKTNTKVLGSVWNYIVISVAFASTGLTSTTFIVNSLSETISMGTGYYLDLTVSGHTTIGALMAAAGYSNYWTGTLYLFKIYSQALTPLDSSTICDSSQFSCTLCPAATNKCLNTCAHNYWWSGSSCQKCQALVSYESCVRNDKSSNLCYDITCSVCESFESGSCTVCKPHATLTSGSCSCDTNYVWDVSTEACVYCDPLSKVTLQGVCLSGCPTGYTATSGLCVGTPGKIFEVQLDKLIRGQPVDLVNGLITVQTGLLPQFYPYYDLTDPYAGKDRGYYFNGYSSYMDFLTSGNNQNQLILSPEFAISFWLFPVHYGVIFARQSNGVTGILIELTQDYYVKVTVLLSKTSGTVVYTSASKVVTSTWNFVGVTFSVLSDTSTVITVVINQVTETPVSLGANPYVDFQSSYTCTLGALYNSSNMLTNYYTGYIRSISVWNTDQPLNTEVLTACTGGCSFCPTTGICPPICTVDQFYSSSCSSCRSECKSKGCVRAQDCNLCADQLCEVCGDYSTSGCSKCVDGANLVNGVCTCITGGALTRPNGNQYCGTTCMSYCSACYGANNGDCYACATGYYLDAGGLCLPGCQTGSVPQGNGCVGSGNAEILHYVFNTTINNPKDLDNGLYAFMGSTSKYAPSLDPNDPAPSYLRGLYFDGNAKYVQLPPNPADSTVVTIGNTHSIRVWVRVSSGAGTSTVLVKEVPPKIYLQISIDSGLNPTVLYRVAAISNGAESTFTANGKTLVANAWNELIFVYLRSGRYATATVYVNGYAGTTGYIANSYFAEPLTCKFKVGYSESSLTSFNGFIYELIIYNYAIPIVNPGTYTCSCSACTASGDCLSSCGIQNYINPDKTCGACLSSCTSGCVNGNLCTFNGDPLCGVFTGFRAADCVSCIPLASMSAGVCQCVSNTIATPTTCTCISNYEQVDNACMPCFYHLQASDIDSHFSEDFFSLEFDLKYKVGSQGAGCESLFTSETLALFGDEYTCEWSDDGLGLTVALGNNAQVKNNTVVSFVKNSLLTSISQCGSNRGPISVSIYYKYTLPVIIPSAYIESPDDYYIFCGDLRLSGAYSTGNYGRALIFSWTFQASPQVPILQQNFSLPIMIFPNSTLNPSTVTVTLNVTNWLGYSNSLTKTLRIHDGIGIMLVQDNNINWEFTSDISKSIYVESTSSCKISSNLTYHWELLSFSGKDAYVNESLLWSSQRTVSKLYIPKGALGPGVYLFQLTVKDLDLNLTGKTTLRVVVNYSNLLVNFNPPYTTISNKNDYMLDGNAAIDPNNVAGTMIYSWSCFNGTNCTGIISNPSARQPIIPKSYLLQGNLFNFTLNVTKSNRNALGTLTVKVNTTSTINGRFSSVPYYINNQENYVLRLGLDKECNCTFKWSFVSGGTFKMSTDVNSKDLGIVPYSMTSGVNYVVQVEATDVGGEASVYRMTFIVDIPPKGGVLIIDKDLGMEYNTVFRLTAPNWYDPKGFNLPLTYQFGYYLENQEYYVNIRNESSTFFTKLPEGNPVKVFVRVYNTYNSYSEATYNVKVTYSALNCAHLIEAFSSYTSLSWADPDTLPGQLTALALYVTSSSSNDSDIYSGYQASIAAIEKLKDSLQDADFGKIDVILNMINVTTMYNVSDGNKTELFQLLNSITDIISSENVIMSSDRAQSYVEVISNIFTFNAFTVVSDPLNLNQANEVLKSLALASSQTMGQTQSITYGSDQIQAYFKLYQGDDLWNLTDPSFTNISYISLPDNSQLSFNSTETILEILTVYNAVPGLYNTSSEYSSAVEFSLIKIYNDSQTYLKLILDPDDINVTIPLWNVDSYPPKCVYWDASSAWSNDGCSFVKLGNNASNCACNHMSLYSSGSHFGIGDDNDMNPGPIIIFIVCIVAFLWFFIACCLFIKDRKENDSKVFIEKVLAALPPIMGKKSPRYLPNEVADNLGKNWRVGERDESKKDSQYVPAAKIGVIGAYFDEKAGHEGDSKESGVRSAHGESLKLKQRNPFGNQGPVYEELKETDMENDYRGHPRLSALSSFPEAYNILPSDELQRIKNPSNNPRLQGVSDLPGNQIDPSDPQALSNYQGMPRMAGPNPLPIHDSALSAKPSNPSYKSGPKLAGVTPLFGDDASSSQHNPAGSRPYQGGPRIEGVQPLHSDDRNPEGKLSKKPSYKPGAKLGTVSEINQADPSAENPGKPASNFNPGSRMGVSALKNVERDPSPQGKAKGPQHDQQSLDHAKKSAYKSGPKLAGVTDLDYNEGESRPPLGSERGLSGDFEHKTYMKHSERDFSRNNSRGSTSSKKFQPPIEIDPNDPNYQVLKPQQEDYESGDVGVVNAYFEYKDPSNRKQYAGNMVIEEFSENPRVFVGSGEVAGGEPKLLNVPADNKAPKPLEEEKYPENTELFTQPDSPKNRMQARKKHADQEVLNLEENQPRVYPSWIANYYFSAILFYHENYTRLSRCAQGVISFFLQTIFIGLIISGMGQTYWDEKGETIETQASKIEFQDVAVAFSMVIITNFIVGAMLCLFFRRRVMGLYSSDSEKEALQKRNRRWETAGFVVIAVIIIGTIVGVGLLEMSINASGSILWVICLFIAFIFDFFVVQILKVLVYNYFTPGLILPAN